MPIESSETFQFPYQPLGNDEIRLITLQPGGGVQPITCTISHVSLASKPEFEALSYVWGDQVNEKRIVLGGVPAAVRENLWSALYHLRRSISHEEEEKEAPSRDKVLETDLIRVNQEDIKGRNDQMMFMRRNHLPRPTSDDKDEPAQRERVLWVDALCINQQDVKERNHQVAFMKRIYSESKATVVWLGPAADQSDMGFDFVKRHDLSSDYTQVCPEEILSLKAIFSRAYWTRVWTAQEFFLARKVSLTCGRRVLDWNAYGMNSIFDQCHWSASRDQKISYDVNKHICRLREPRSTEPNTHTLGWYLGMTQHSLCMDPRDKIYGILGMVWPSPHIEIDYSKSLWEIYVDVMANHAQVHYYGDPASFSQRLQFSITGNDGVRDKADLMRVLRGNRKEEAYKARFPDGPLGASSKLMGKITHIGPYQGSDGQFEGQDNQFWTHVVAPEDLARIIPINGSSVFRVPNPFINDWELIIPPWTDSPVIDQDTLDEYLDKAPCYFFTDTERIGLGPATTRIGDSICQFGNCDVAVLVTPTASDGTVLPALGVLAGRVLLLKIPGEREISPAQITTKASKFSIKIGFEIDVSAHLDIETLQLLTF